MANAAFAVAAAEAPPVELAAAADLVTVRFPWGSLLRGVVGGDTGVAAGLAHLLRVGGAIELLVAPMERDGLDGIPTSTAGLAAGAHEAFEPLGFEIERVCEPTPGELRAIGSSWARRLDRRATLIRLVRR